MPTATLLCKSRQMSSKEYLVSLRPFQGVLRFPRERHNVQIIVFVGVRYKHVRIQNNRTEALYTRDVPRDLDRQRTDRTNNDTIRQRHRPHEKTL